MRQTWHLAFREAFRRLCWKTSPGRLGQELSVELQITSSRSSQPAGWLSAKTTAAATSAGALDYRVRRRFVLLSPIVEEVGVHAARNQQCDADLTPVSAASARVKPTTPNFEAQYAVASLTALMPRVDAHVTTRPRLRRR